MFACVNFFLIYLFFQRSFEQSYLRIHTFERYATFVRHCPVVQWPMFNDQCPLPAKSAGNDEPTSTNMTARNGSTWWPSVRPSRRPLVSALSFDAQRTCTGVSRCPTCAALASTFTCSLTSGLGIVRTAALHGWRILHGKKLMWHLPSWAVQSAAAVALMPLLFFAATYTVTSYTF